MGMTWPRRRKKECDAEVALSEAQANLDRIKKRSPEVTAVAEASRRLLAKNQFAERLEGIMGGQT